MDIAVLIPMYGLNDMTRECVGAVIENAGMECDIIVVDDGSKTPYQDDRVTVIRIEENSGFTNAVNRGIQNCGNYKYIHLLNNDTLPEPNFLVELYNVMERDSRIAVASSVRVTGDKEEGYGADLIRGHQYYIRDAKAPAPVIWVPFCSVMLSTSAIKYIGLLDPFMRNCCSDTDFCLRARIYGWKVYLVPASRVKHVIGVTMRHVKYMPDKDLNRFIQKISGVLYSDIMSQIPLDCERKIWGRIEFGTVQKQEVE